MYVILTKSVALIYYVSAINDINDISDVWKWVLVSAISMTSMMFESEY